MEDAKKILVIDDDPTIIKLLVATLTSHGYRVVSAPNGKEGLDVYKAEDPDLIILDIIMPEMDGYTFVQEFKKIEKIKEIPILMLTSKANMQDIFKVEGINDYIIKPFHIDYLLKKVETRLKFPTKSILVVDDAVANVEIIKEALSQRGYHVITAFNGMEALEKAKHERPDLMILDVMMPKLNGYQVCRMLKFDEKYKHIDVVVLTARAQEGDQQLAKEVGANTYIVKPFNGNDLLHTIKDLLWG